MADKINYKRLWSNANSTSGGSGGSENLQQVLTNGNSTGGLNITSPDGLSTLLVEDGDIVIESLIINLGDTSDNENGSILSIIDATKRLLFAIAGHSYLDFNVGAARYQFGDSNAQANGTFLDVNDGIQASTLTGKYNGNLGSNFLQTNFSSGVVLIGDISENGNKILLSIDDGGNVVTLTGEYNSIISTLLQIVPSTCAIKLGDISISQNGGQFLLNDNANISVLANTNLDLKVGINVTSPQHSLDVGGDAINIQEGTNIILGTTTGTIIGTNPSQLLGFFGNNGVIQQEGDISTALSNLGLVVNCTNNIPHTIFIPHTGNTITLLNNTNNIINPLTTLLALTVVLPFSPNDNDVVQIKYTKAITTVTYTGGTVNDGVVSPILGTLVTLTYDQGTSTWY